MKILIAVDGSDYSRRAIEFVASRQRLIGSSPEIEVLNVQLPLHANPARVVGKEVVRSYYAEEAEKILKPARARLQRAGLRPVVRYAVGRPATEISATADKNNVDLLVLGSHGHSALAGMLLGSVTNEVLVRTKRAMLIVRGKAKSHAESLKVGIAVDGSRYGREAVKYVLRHLELFGARPRITLVHVVQNFALTGMPSMADIAPPAFSEGEVQALQARAFEDAIAPLRALVKKVVEGAPSHLAPVVEAHEVRLIGDPGNELSAYAKEKLDLLVLGSHGYGAFKAAVMGSVATRVTANCTVPLLLVRH